jgi:hypothetical protein
MAARVIPAALAAMVERGAAPGRIRAAIGPAVHGACYQVGDEVRAAFAASFGELDGLFHGDRLDLPRAAWRELTGHGVRPGSISVVPLCTHCEAELASYRREGTARSENLAVIALIGS